jgi:hypothetical protein
MNTTFKLQSLEKVFEGLRSQWRCRGVSGSNSRQHKSYHMPCSVWVSPHTSLTLPRGPCNQDMSKHFQISVHKPQWRRQDVGCTEAYLGTEVDLEICTAGWCINPLRHLVNWHQGGIWWRVLTLKALPTANVQERTQHITKTVSRQWLKKCLLGIYDQLQVCQHCFDLFFTKWLLAPTIFSHSTLNWLAIFLLT